MPRTCPRRACLRRWLACLAAAWARRCSSARGRRRHFPPRSTSRTRTSPSSAAQSPACLVRARGGAALRAATPSRSPLRQHWHQRCAPRACRQRRLVRRLWPGRCLRRAPVVPAAVRAATAATRRRQPSPRARGGAAARVSRIGRRHHRPWPPSSHRRRPLAAARQCARSSKRLRGAGHPILPTACSGCTAASRRRCPPQRQLRLRRRRPRPHQRMPPTATTQRMQTWRRRRARARRHRCAPRRPPAGRHRRWRCRLRRLLRRL